MDPVAELEAIAPPADPAAGRDGRARRDPHGRERAQRPRVPDQSRSARSCSRARRRDLASRVVHQVSKARPRAAPIGSICNRSFRSNATSCASVTVSGAGSAASTCAKLASRWGSPRLRVPSAPPRRHPSHRVPFWLSEHRSRLAPCSRAREPLARMAFLRSATLSMATHCSGRGAWMAHRLAQRRRQRIRGATQPWADLAGGSRDHRAWGVC